MLTPRLIVLVLAAFASTASFAARSPADESAARDAEWQIVANLSPAPTPAATNAQPIPEPAALAPVAGAALVALRRRRRAC